MKQKLQKLIKTARRTQIIAFSEKPAETQDGTSKNNNEKKELSASALFSHFTANIIKEEKVFTR